MFYPKARGAPHLHCLLWLRGDNDEEPPVLWSNSDDIHNQEKISKSIASFSSSLIHGSVHDVHCENHDSFKNECDQCSSLRNDVERYQIHRHTFTCHKKKKRIIIKYNEGHGRLDGKMICDELELKSCRFNYPRPPLDSNEFIFGFKKEDDNDIVKGRFNKLFL